MVQAIGKNKRNRKLFTYWKGQVFFYRLLKQSGVPDRIVAAALDLLVLMLSKFKDAMIKSPGVRVGGIRAVNMLLRRAWGESSDGLLEAACGALTSVCGADEENRKAA